MKFIRHYYLRNHRRVISIITDEVRCSLDKSYKRDSGFTGRRKHLNFNKGMLKSLSRVFLDSGTWMLHLEGLYFTILSKYLVNKNCTNGYYFYEVFLWKYEVTINASLQIGKFLIY